jgi:hypothetical protein
MNQVEKIGRFVAGPAFPALASAVVGGLLIVALCFPNAQGPADNGDFARVFTVFCSAPRDLPYFSSPGEPSYSKRFFNFYHRYWAIGDEHRGAVQRSSSLVLFLPGLLGPLVCRAQYYDLAFNALLLALGISCVTFLVVRRLSDVFVRVSAVILLLVMTDAGCSAYLNSFYQEAGIFFFFLLCLLFLFLWSERRSGGRVMCVTIVGLLLMLAKNGAAPSVAALLLPVLGLSAFSRREGRRARRASAGAFALVLIGGLTVPFIFKNPWYEKINCYNFIFSAALPELKPSERDGFLHLLGIDQRQAAYSGKTAWEAGNNFQDGVLNPLLGPKLHARAASTLILGYPHTAFRLVAGAARLAGAYPLDELGYKSFQFSPDRQPLGSVQAWSLFRLRVLRGLWAYGVGCLVVFLVAALALKTNPGPKLLVSGLVLGSFLASLLQVFVAVLGDGQHELARHLYFANLTLDTSLVLGAVILSAHFMRRQGAVCTAGPLASNDGNATPARASGDKEGLLPCRVVHCTVGRVRAEAKLSAKS